MPHQCTNCGRRFDDGSKEMLSGCPDCGGNKFQFKPSGSADAESPGPDPDRPAGGADASDGQDDAPSESGGLTDRVADTGSTVRDWVRSSGSDSSDPPQVDSPEPATPGVDDASSPPTESTDPADDPADPAEDRAQQSARSDVVTEEELDRVATDAADAPPTDADGTVIEPSDDDQPSLDDLREELNDQFESIRIVNPGQYELNLMELYDRDEYIISLQEDGRYVIEVPDAWRDEDE